MEQEYVHSIAGVLRKQGKDICEYEWMRKVQLFKADQRTTEWVFQYISNYGEKSVFELSLEMLKLGYHDIDDEIFLKLLEKDSRIEIRIDKRTLSRSVVAKGGK